MIYKLQESITIKSITSMLHLVTGSENSIYFLTFISKTSKSVNASCPGLDLFPMEFICMSVASHSTPTAHTPWAGRTDIASICLAVITRPLYCEHGLDAQCPLQTVSWGILFSVYEACPVYPTCSKGRTSHGCSRFIFLTLLAFYFITR